MHLPATQPLTSGWTLWDSAPEATEPVVGANSISGCSLPLDVRSTLHQRLESPDPRIDRDSLASDWIAGRTWWLATTIETPELPPGSRLFLATRGCDDQARIFLDGAQVGAAESFNRWDFHALGRPAAGGHELALRLRPWDQERIAVGPPLRATRDEADFKSVMFAGCDHNPPLVNAGVAVPPSLVVAHGGLLRNVGIAYAFDADGTSVSGTVRVDLDAWEEVQVEVRLIPANFTGSEHVLRWTCAPGTGLRSLPFANLAVERWQPWSHGTPHCYTLELRLGEQVLATQAGFRTVEKRRNAAFPARPVASVMDWHPYENNSIYGQEYYKGYDAIREAGEAWPERPREGDYAHDHVVNGKPLFVMGGAVVPSTLFWSDWSADNQRRLARRAREANLNTLRVWGGGYLHDEAFFAECDLLGMVVQHDFLNFATFKDRTFAAQRRREREFRSLARELSAHPSVMVFNGGNELLQIGNRPLDPLFAVMARVVGEESPQQLFHLSCPMNPEVHGPWFFDLDHAARYASAKSILNSECGVMAAPSLKTLRRTFTPPVLADALGTEWQHRVNDEGYFRTLVRNIELFTPSPQAEAALAVRCSQWTQALGYQVIVEEHRRQKPATSGFTIWEFNEPWVDLNWGLLDVDLLPKHSFSAFRRAAAGRLASARVTSFVFAPGARFSAEIHLSGDAQDPYRATVVAQLLDAQGRIIGSATCGGSCTGDSLMIGALEAVLPDSGVVHLRLTAICADGQRMRNDYVFCVLPARQGPAIRGAFISGGCYEDGTSLEFLRAAGFDLTVHHASPDRPLAADAVDLAACQVVVLGPVFNPLTSLGTEFLKRLDAAVRAGTGLVYLGYCTTAYASGRYAVDDLAGSPLEALLPATFPADCYRNSADPITGGPLMRQGDHPLWTGIDLRDAPDPGLGVRLAPKPGAQVLATRGADPAILAGLHGIGRVVALAGGYGGHNYQEVGLRGWSQFHRLLANLLEVAATGTVRGDAPTAQAFAPLLALPPAEVSATIAKESIDGDRAAWTVQVRNRGSTTAFAIQIGNGDPTEGRAFDWHTTDDFITLIPGEERHVVVSASARAGQSLPKGLRPEIAPWPATIGHDAGHDAIRQAGAGA